MQLADTEAKGTLDRHRLWAFHQEGLTPAPFQRALVQTDFHIISLFIACPLDAISLEVLALA
ncbi:MAG: hypothetical protein EBV34_09615 [Betaproteobacteria bacterium]|nr:hypothetical protein [Betaproteobacteria bacterium]